MTVVRTLIKKNNTSLEKKALSSASNIDIININMTVSHNE